MLNLLFCFPLYLYAGAGPATCFSSAPYNYVTARFLIDFWAWLSIILRREISLQNRVITRQSAPATFWAT